MKKASIRRSLVVLAALALLPVHAGAQAQPKVITLGADLNEGQRAALMARFGAAPGDKVLTVTTADMTAAMQGIYAIPPGYVSVSSSALTCGAPGNGIHVTTEHITKVTAAMFAGALVTAGIGDSDLIVAAPPDAEAEGMTGLTGVFKGFQEGACGRGAIDPARRELAYRWLVTANGLGSALGDQSAATGLLLRAQQAVVENAGGDPAGAEQALNSATAGSGVTISPEQREAVLDLLRRVAQAKIDWGGYAKGWDLQEISPAEVRLTPHGAGAGAQAGGGSTLNGMVRTALGPESYLVIDAPGQQGQLNLNASSVVVTRDGQPARLSDLQAGDTVAIQIGPDNVARRIDARSGSAGSTEATRIVVGTVNDNNETRLTVNTATGSQQFTIPPGAYVARDGKAADLGAVKVNDSATLVISSTGNVQAVFAQPAGNQYLLDGTARGPVDGTTLVVRTGTQTIAVPVPQTGVAVTRNGKAASLADIRASDQVTVHFDVSSRPISIDATGSGGLVGRLRSPWLLLLCLVPLLLLLGLFLWRRDRVEQALLVLPRRRRRPINPADVDDLLG